MQGMVRTSEANIFVELLTVYYVYFYTNVEPTSRLHLHWMYNVIPPNDDSDGGTATRLAFVTRMVDNIIGMSKTIDAVQRYRRS